jgi:hypothetical protein
LPLETRHAQRNIGLALRETANALALFRRKGKRAFDAEAEEARRAGGSPAH